MFSTMRRAVRKIHAVLESDGCRHGRRTLRHVPRLEDPLEERALLATLVLPNTSVPTFWASFPVNEDGNIAEADEDVSGGNFLGTLNGTTLAASYCISINLTISPLSTYNNATVTSKGTI